MRILPVLLLVSAAAFAGCTSDDPHDHGTDFTCPDGTIIAVANDTAHHDDGYDPAAACPVDEPIDLPASLAISGLPGTSLAYSPLSFEWVLSTDEAEAHAMLTAVRASRTSVADDALTGPDSFGESVAKKEHQNFVDGTSFVADWQPTAAGTYFLRAYATVSGFDIWSPEYAVVIEDVQPTGNTVTVTVTAGGPLLASTEPAAADAVLGDALVFQNDDAFDHTFNWTGGPVDLDGFTVAAGAATEPVVLLVPGTYTYETDDLQAITGTVTVAAP